MSTSARGASIEEEVARLSRALVAACERLHRRGLLAGYEGNLSVRLSNGDLLVTPSGADKAEMTPAQICWTDATGSNRHVGALRDSAARPSSELQMHLACYAARPAIQAVVHAHPPVATGFAAAGLTLPNDVLPELPVVVGPIAFVPYARPGTPALARAMQPFLALHQVFLLANHGVTTLGVSLSDAVLRMESVEQSARVLVVARLLGGEQRLGGDEVAALLALHAAGRDGALGSAAAKGLVDIDATPTDVTHASGLIRPYSANGPQDEPT